MWLVQGVSYHVQHKIRSSYVLRKHGTKSYELTISYQVFSVAYYTHLGVGRYSVLDGLWDLLRIARTIHCFVQRIEIADWGSFSVFNRFSLLSQGWIKCPTN